MADQENLNNLQLMSSNDNLKIFTCNQRISQLVELIGNKSREIKNILNCIEEKNKTRESEISLQSREIVAFVVERAKKQILKNLEDEKQNETISNLVFSINEKSREILCRINCVNQRWTEESSQENKSKQVELEPTEVEKQCDILKKDEQSLIIRRLNEQENKQPSRNPINLALNFLASLKLKELFKRFFTFIQSAMGVVKI